MKSKLLFIAFFFAAISTSFAQELTYKKGRIFNSENKKLSFAEVEKLLESKPELLVKFNQGRTKASVGGVILSMGSGLIVADLLIGLTKDKVYPSGLTYVGLTAAVLSIPILLGHGKKIKSVIDDYNQSLAPKTSSFNFEKLTLISNKNGIGMLVTF